MSILFGKKKTIVYLIVPFIDFVSVGAAGKEKKREKRGGIWSVTRKKKKKNREIKSQGRL